MTGGSERGHHLGGLLRGTEQARLHLRKPEGGQALVPQERDAERFVVDPEQGLGGEDPDLTVLRSRIANQLLDHRR